MFFILGGWNWNNCQYFGLNILFFYVNQERQGLAVFLCTILDDLKKKKAASNEKEDQGALQIEPSPDEGILELFMQPISLST